MVVGHLQLDVCVVGNDHELDVVWPPQYGVVGPWQVHHLELQLFGVEIRGVSERNSVTPRILELIFFSFFSTPQIRTLSFLFFFFSLCLILFQSYSEN